MKIAIVHDDLMRRGGAEQVVLSMLKAFPEADLFTMCYNPELTYPEFRKHKIHRSFLNRFAKTEKRMKMLFFPLGIIAMKLLRIRDYEVVIISNTYCAKYVSIDARSIVFIYTYTPFRLAWNPESYPEFNKSKGLSKLIFKLVISLLRLIDKKEARKGSYFLSMTKETAERVKKAYGVNQVDIIHPPVKSNNFYVNNESEKNYYLIVSRLEYYKNIHLAINAFNELHYNLIIVGDGSKRHQLESMANKNIQFKRGLSKEEIAELYANCIAFIFPQHEDYGITPLEANASGRPVIAYGDGGVKETMIPYAGENKKFTSIFFNEQTVPSLIVAIRLFESLDVDSQIIRHHAEKFDENIFVKEFVDYIEEKLKRANA